MPAPLQQWLRERLALPTEPGRALPKGIGWLQTFGVAAVVLLVIEGITGIFLAMYYAPHPDAAYESLRYIDQKLAMGLLVHSLHHYGASAVVLLVGLHLLRTYVQGTYKRPRELNWLLGLALLGLVVAFGITGHLLPWDQNAYHGTVVRADIAGKVPLIGATSRTLMLGGGEVGALTLTRFYAIHALLLPALLIPLLQLHAWLGRRMGPAAPGVPVDQAPPSGERTGDRQLLRGAVAVLVAVIALYVCAVFFPVEPEFKANAADTTYHARPEWYLMFLFQFVHDFPELPGMAGLPEWIAPVGIPGLALTFLVLAPWIDRSRERAATRRPLMMAALFVGVFAVGGLTVRAYALLVHSATPKSSLYGQYTGGGDTELDPQQVAEGKAAFVVCSGCHRAYGDYPTAKLGPDLTGYGLTTFLTTVPGHPEMEGVPFHERFVRYVRGKIRPRVNKQDVTLMPKYTEEMLPQSKLEAIGAYLSQDPKQIEILQHKDPRADSGNQ